ncbi:MULTISPECIES: NrfD/PsrC family molybdoenzyme membrane anchor subunit [Bacillota]|uniref:Selenate reductase subunit C n=1 Tax=Mesobacillus selenatarsenatis (strain DSM 18680 / JCM 14380 / FERM P-15431 / SF-1) TaxID=1321606 RepID=SRDC_MESS1|nr:NrfD/PsrC family molybdoenzyme membrane anchor subunit [Mesobacillus selenatarsenatis]BAJ83593.1 putative selenate reductase subunit C [Mesobacillus selenatarsenatis SF-1]GAM13407.1 molybdopterin oxidoreductase membrane subunit [Mesobacillus selenatarsenatis SF-1]
MLKKLYFTVLSFIAIVGVISLYIRLSEGMKMSALTSYSSWGLWIVFYIYFIGLSAGSFLLSTMVYVFNMKQFERIGKLALFTAFFSLMAGLLFVLIDLGHPERFWHTLVYRQPNSILSWEIQFYLIYMLLIVAEIWFLMREEFAQRAQSTKGLTKLFNRTLTLGYKVPNSQQKLEFHREQSHKWMKILGIAGIPTAVGVHGGTGSLFGVVMAKEYWFSGLTPIIFLVSALVSGAALMLFLYSFFGGAKKNGDSLLKELGTLLTLFIGIDLLLMIAEFLIGLYNPIHHERMTFNEILFGDRWFIFWIGQIGMVIILPILLITISKGKRLLMGLAGLSVVLGIVCVRWILVIPAYVAPHFDGLDSAYNSSRLLYEYSPNLLEWSSSVGLIGIVILLFSITVQLVPVFNKQKEVHQTHGKPTPEIHIKA